MPILAKPSGPWVTRMPQRQPTTRQVSGVASMGFRRAYKGLCRRYIRGYIGVM